MKYSATSLTTLPFWFVISLVFSPQLSAQSMTSSGSESASEMVMFESVQPILRKHCLRCHNEDQPRGDLVLTSLDKVLAGSSSGPVVVAGRLDESPLYTLTAHLDSPKMPPNKPQIPQREINVIERWIIGGLVEEMKPTITKPLEPESKPQESKSTPQSALATSQLFAFLQTANFC